MLKMLTCPDCDYHTFIFVSGNWEKLAKTDQFSSPFAVFCSQCGHGIDMGRWLDELISNEEVKERHQPQVKEFQDVEA